MSSSSKGSKAPAVASILKRKYEEVFDTNVSTKIKADASTKLQGDELSKFQRSLMDAIVVIRTVHEDLF